MNFARRTFLRALAAAAGAGSIARGAPASAHMLRIEAVDIIDVEALRKATRKIVVSHIPDDVSFAVAPKYSSVPSSPAARHTIVRDHHAIGRLLDALRDGHAYPSPPVELDYRWCVQFYDNDATLLAALYFTSFGRECRTAQTGGRFIDDSFPAYMRATFASQALSNLTLPLDIAALRSETIFAMIYHLPDNILHDVAITTGELRSAPSVVRRGVSDRAELGKLFDALRDAKPYSTPVAAAHEYRRLIDFMGRTPAPLLSFFLTSAGDEWRANAAGGRFARDTFARYVRKMG